MPSAIILAAGSSTRLGRPKQDIRMGNETLLERTVRFAYLAGLSPIFVVVSQAASAEVGDTNFPPTCPVEVLINHLAGEGMASSIRVGVQACIRAAAIGAVVLACDQVSVTPEHLLALARAETVIRASSYAGRKGIPAYFPGQCFEELLRLTGDTGARDLLRHAEAVPLLNGDLDIDTATDLARARELYPELGDR